MALHKVIYPNSARLLFLVVALQKRLLKALADPELQAGTIDVAWMQRVWGQQAPEWVRKFCLGGQLSVLPQIQEVAAAPIKARQALVAQFTRQNRLRKMLRAGGRIYEPVTLPYFTDSLAESVKLLFGRFYQRLGHNTGEAWHGYEFPGGHTLVNRAYKDDFSQVLPRAWYAPTAMAKLALRIWTTTMPSLVIHCLHARPGI